MIADPKAIQHIFQTSAYNYPKRADLVQLSKLVIGRGILGASGLLFRCLLSIHSRF